MAQSTENFFSYSVNGRTFFTLMGTLSYVFPYTIHAVERGHQGIGDALTGSSEGDEP